MSDNSKLIAELVNLISNISADRFYAILVVLVVVVVIWKVAVQFPSKISSLELC